MGRVHIIDVNMDGFLIQKPIQSRLDAFLFNKTEAYIAELIGTGIKLPEKPLGLIGFR